MSSPNFSLLSLALLLISLSIIPHLASASLKEETALLKWKASLQIPNNSQLVSSWTPLPTNSSAPVSCSWYGISCNADGNIYRLNLTTSELKGTLHKFPFSILHNLTRFELSVNNFSGPVLPEIGLLSKLVYLDFSANQFSGSIPPEIEMLANLETLHFNENHFNGSIPPEIGQLTSLYELALYDNSLQGELPKTLCSIKKLAYLYLDDNNLSGQIPTEFGQLVNLLEVYITNNFLEGPIPPTIGHNQLSGQFPTSLEYPNLLQLKMDHNQLSGQFPTSVCNMNNLKYLDMSNNRFGESIPQCFGNITSSLVAIRMGNNSFQGTIPNMYWDCQLLQGLILKGNQLRGEVPISLSNCKSLKVVDFGNNHLNGTFPGWLGDLPNLHALVLKSNNFHGHIIQHSSVIESPFPSLRILDLSHNGFDEISVVGLWSQSETTVTDILYMPETLEGLMEPMCCRLDEFTWKVYTSRQQHNYERRKVNVEMIEQSVDSNQRNNVENDNKNGSMNGKEKMNNGAWDKSIKYADIVAASKLDNKLQIISTEMSENGEESLRSNELDYFFQRRANPSYFDPVWCLLTHTKSAMSIRQPVDPGAPFSSFIYLVK
ncbi:leucine-rich repeat receptor-like protein kinase family protein [Artemisia annua]|uniref:Leucine-rich repeat receptor-like protein kinase family protein n=1 Tax=Artemisia annua TaxID=35608 RepID=A0A2U1P208_ARTAN|nr:leucine-rich repeat receptor-like protein kinase family protein [Artemisia annua]